MTFAKTSSVKRWHLSWNISICWQAFLKMLTSKLPMNSGAKDIEISTIVTQASHGKRPNGSIWRPGLGCLCPLKSPFFVKFFPCFGNGFLHAKLQASLSVFALRMWSTQSSAIILQSPRVELSIVSHFSEIYF